MTKYFVYQAWTEDRLYASGLTKEAATERAGELDRLIASGCCGNGCAVIGNLLDESDFFVAQRLGLIDESFASWEEWDAFMQNIGSDLSLISEHDAMYGTGE